MRRLKPVLEGPRLPSRNPMTYPNGPRRARSRKLMALSTLGGMEGRRNVESLAGRLEPGSEAGGPGAGRGAESPPAPPSAGLLTACTGSDCML